MATAKKNTEIYDEVRCDFHAMLLEKTLHHALESTVSEAL